MDKTKMQIIEFEKENLASIQVRDLCDSLERDEVKAVSLRECVLTDKDYKRILKSVAVCKNLRHLSFNIGIISDTFRIQVLAQALQKNKSLTGLFIHGNEIGDAGMKILQPSLVKHPRILSLDVGDCKIGDEGLDVVCRLLVPKHERQGLEELVLSANPGITAKGWAKLGVAIAAGCNLRSLYVDYNELGDSSASCLLVAVAGAKSLETLDMECVGASESTGQVLLHLIQNYSVSFHHLNLDENEITAATLEAIRMHIPNLTEDDQSNGIHSDDERSLAMSEPPLDPHSDLGEFGSPVNCITIVGATDSPIYTPDVIGTDRSVPTETDSPDNAALSVSNMKLDETRSEKKADMSSETEMQETETQVSVQMNGDNQSDTNLQQVKVVEEELPEKTNILEKDSAKQQASTTSISLADRIKLQRDKKSEISSVIVSPAGEKEDESNVLLNKEETKSNTKVDSLFVVKSKGSTGKENGHKSPPTKLPAKVESVEQVEDIEEMDEAEINSAHDTASVVGTPSKMLLCSGPGVRSSTSIFDDNQLLQASPSSGLNRQRRYSYNIEMKQEEQQSLQGVSKHRASEGNINTRFANRRGSTMSNARLTVHGVGSSTNINDLQASDTKRRLSCASTLGDVDIEHFH